ncbi:citrate transporter-domain-containing protein [Phlyctochytrium arcticum]|nr:citrate transporter-domain-containing protein [Phlyctochytrium arcticum]
MSLWQASGPSQQHHKEPKFGYRAPQTWLALSVFVAVWLLVAKKWAMFPIGRTAAALLGASALVLGGVLSPEDALDSVSSNTLLLLAGLMIILAKLEEKGVMSTFKKILLWRSPSPIMLLARVSVLSAVLGATTMNDGAAIFLSNVVSNICDQGDLPIEPFALALATSANIGSAATIIGNPKNMIVHDMIPEIDFLGFFLKMGPIAMLATAVNTLSIVAYYWKSLHGKRIERLKSLLRDGNAAFGEVSEVEQEEYDDSELLNHSNGASDDETSLLFTDDGSGDSDSGDDDHPHVNGHRTSRGAVSIEVPGELTPLHGKLKSSPSIDFDFYRQQSPDLRHRKPWQQPPNPHCASQTRLSLSLYQTIAHPAEYTFESRQPLELAKLVHDIPTQIPYPRTPVGYIRFHMLMKLRDMIHSPSLIHTLYGLILLMMYVSFFYPVHLGFSTLAAATSLLVVDALVTNLQSRQPATRDIAVPTPNIHPMLSPDPTSTISEAVNWPLLGYLFGMFIILEGVRQTPFPGDLWKLFGDALNGGWWITVMMFSIITVITCLIFTSIPAVLLLAPHIRQLYAMDPRWATAGWFLLSWNVTVCGSITPFGSVAGLIVSEVCRKSGERWVGDVRVWMRYASWATTLVLATFGHISSLGPSAVVRDCAMSPQSLSVLRKSFRPERQFATCALLRHAPAAGDMPTPTPASRDDDDRAFIHFH